MLLKIIDIYIYPFQRKIGQVFVHLYVCSRKTLFILFPYLRTDRLTSTASSSSTGAAGPLAPRPLLLSITERGDAVERITGSESSREDDWWWINTQRIIFFNQQPLPGLCPVTADCFGPLVQVLVMCVLILIYQILADLLCSPDTDKHVP